MPVVFQCLLPNHRPLLQFKNRYNIKPSQQTSYIDSLSVAFYVYIRKKGIKPCEIVLQGFVSEKRKTERKEKSGELPAEP